MRPQFPRFGHTLRRDYTDLAVVMGPNMRWVENDVYDLMRYRPEVLLGYRIRLVVPNNAIRGLQIKKLIILEGPYSKQQERQMMDAVYMVEFWEFGKIETWSVHGRDIWRVS